LATCRFEFVGSLASNAVTSQTNREVFSALTLEGGTVLELAKFAALAPHFPLMANSAKFASTKRVTQ